MGEKRTPSKRPSRSKVPTVRPTEGREPEVLRPTSVRGAT